MPSRDITVLPKPVRADGEGRTSLPCVDDYECVFSTMTNSSFAEAGWCNSRQASELLGDDDKAMKGNQLAEEMLGEGGEVHSNTVTTTTTAAPTLAAQEYHLSRCISYNPYNPYDPWIFHACCYCEHCTRIHNENDGCATVMSGVVLAAVNDPVAEVISFPAECPEPVHENRMLPPQQQQSPSPFPRTPSGGASRSYHGRLAGGGQTLMGSRTVSSASTDSDNARAIVGGMGPRAYSSTRVSFMPPPPPPRVMTSVLAQERVPGAQRTYYCTILRWYRKLHMVQHFWVPPEEACPPPAEVYENPPYTFDDWCDMVDAWWFSHFENMQVKPPRYHTPSSGTALSKLW